MKYLARLIILPTLVTALQAAEPATPPVVAPPAPAPVPAPAPHPVDPALLALAHDVIKVMQADKPIERLSAQMQQFATGSLNLKSPNLTPEQRAKAEKALADVSALAAEASRNLAARLDAVFAEVFTETELRAMKAFFDSPEGRSFTAKRSQLDQRLAPTFQAMQRELMPKISQIISAARPPTATPTPGGAPMPGMPLPTRSSGPVPANAPVPPPTPSSTQQPAQPPHQP